MATTMPKHGEIKRDWYVLDAAGKPVGRVAAKAAELLRGKHKTIFAPFVDCGDYVIVINTDKAVFTGNKLDRKFYYRHSGYIGGLKKVSAREMMAKRSDRAVLMAVRGMLPHNTQGANQLKRLRAYKGDTHKQGAQKPTAVAV